MADVASGVDTTILAIGFSVIAAVFSIFIYFRFFCSRGSVRAASKSSPKKAKKPEKKSALPTANTAKSQPQKVATPTRSPKMKEAESQKDQILATTDEEDWVKVKPSKTPQMQAAKPAKSPKQENQPKKNRQQANKSGKTTKKNDKVERKNSPDGSTAPSYVIPPPNEKQIEEEWQEITSKKRKPRARKE